ncbi:MAG TPA: MarR family transcriptional regulator [Gemmatimonadaceae bacterium]|nr:MarR family transcriptional regulator [Gemmatimonadaceae bacterium]
MPARRKFLLQRLLDLGRLVSTRTVFLHQAIAQQAGLNATDTKCVDLILRGPAEGVTAGWLSEQAGLTTGAITHILDRLERRHVIERVRDTEDRRRVFLRVHMETLEPMAPYYDAIAAAFGALSKHYSDEELEVICDYMERASEVSERELAKLRARATDTTRPSPRRPGTSIRS